MEIPALVTTSPDGTPRDEAGVLGFPGTDVLYGATDVLTGHRSGLHILTGIWIDSHRQVGLQLESYGFGSVSEGFVAESTFAGVPILARPYFNINPRDPLTLDLDPPARDDSHLISFPNQLGGSVAVASSSELSSFGLGVRLFLAGFCCGPNAMSDVHLVSGYRYLSLKDDLRITEDLNSLIVGTPLHFDITDEFQTSNSFHGIDFGMIWRFVQGKATFDYSVKVAVGNVHQKVNISGVTVRQQPNFDPVEDVGGLLAQPSNIGEFKRDRFATIPEIGIGFSYYVRPQIRLRAGYTLLHWSNVVRAGEQVDLSLNPDQFPPKITPIVGASRPTFTYRESSFWAHGLDFGFEYLW